MLYTMEMCQEWLWYFWQNKSQNMFVMFVNEVIDGISVFVVEGKSKASVDIQKKDEELSLY